MLDITQMTARLIIALALGAVMGVERGLVGKEAGVRTAMLVSGGAALFSIISLSLPHIVSEGNLSEVIAGSTFMNVIANIVVGVGFLGAGIILKTQERVHGLTTAAAVWATAAIGVLAGIGMIHLAVVSTVLMAGFLYLLRKFDVASMLKEKGRKELERQE